MRLFENNPRTADTVENIAANLGRKGSTVKLALENLVETGILKSETLNEVTVYMLTSDELTRTLVDRFAFALENRFFRMEAVRQIIPGIR